PSTPVSIIPTTIPSPSTPYCPHTVGALTFSSHHSGQRHSVSLSCGSGTSYVASCKILSTSFRFNYLSYASFVIVAAIPFTIHSGCMSETASCLLNLSNSFKMLACDLSATPCKCSCTFVIRSVLVNDSVSSSLTLVESASFI